nr:uncharacterized protein LOC112584678 isoform X2 [Bubalus bubalis]
MALPRLLGSPRAVAAALPGAGPEGLAPFRPPALPLSSRPRPAPRLAGREEWRALGTQLRRGGDRRLLCDVSSLRGYLYPHDWISFMKPRPGCELRTDQRQFSCMHINDVYFLQNVRPKVKEDGCRG